MLSDACFEISESINRVGIVALGDFDDAVKNYAEKPFTYPILIIQTLRLVISDTRSGRLSIPQFLQVVAMVRAFYDDPKNASFDNLIKRIEEIIGNEYWLRWNA